MNPRLSNRRQPMDSAAVRIRLRDAHTRLDSAELQLTGASPHEWKHAAEVAISAGIAASDAICGHVLGYKIASENHDDAIEALRVATSAATAKHLSALLSNKSIQSYGDRLPSHADAGRLIVHARRLIDTAETTVAS